MISLELKRAYENLDLDDKRNKISDELLMIGELLKTVEEKNGLVPNFKIKNFQSGSVMNEDEFLSFLYEDIFEVQKQLILLADRTNSKRAKE